MKSKAGAIKRHCIPEYRVIDVDPFRSVVKVYGDDPDGGCRTLQVDDLLRIRGGRRMIRWEVMAIDFGRRQVFIKPYRGHHGLDGIDLGVTLEIAELAYDSPGYTVRRTRADRLALGPRPVEAGFEP